MKRFLALVLAIALSGMSLPAFATQDFSASDDNPLIGSDDNARTINVLLQAGEYTEGRVLARVTDEYAPIATYSNEDAVSTSDLYSYAPDASAATARNRVATPTDRVVLVESSTLSTEELLRSLADTPGVLLAEPDYVYHPEEPTAAMSEAVSASAEPDSTHAGTARTAPTTNDPLLEEQWQFASTSDVSGAANVLKLWNEKGILSKKLPEVVVAVADTGVDYHHPDLAQSMWTNPGDIGLDGTYGYDWVDGDDDPMDGSFHGTHVAGIIAAGVNNALGGGGVAPNAKIMALRIGGDDGFTMSRTISAYDYVRRAVQNDEPVVAVNNSWGGQTSCFILNSVIDDLYQNLGVVSICASGNASSNIDQTLANPSGLPSEGIITVNAADKDGSLGDFSNYGAIGTDLAAPGVGILSTVPESQGIAAPERDDTVILQDGFEDDPGLFAFTTGGEATSSVERTGEEWSGTKPSGKSLRWTVDDLHEGQMSELILSSTAFGAAKAVRPGKSLDDVRFLTFDSKVIDSSKSGLSRTLRIFVGSFGNNWIEVTPEEDCYARYETWNTCIVPLSDEQRGLIDWENLSIKITRTFVAQDEGQRLEFGIDTISLVEAFPYDVLDGTSMATPVVTGAYALIAGLFPDEDCTTWRARILGGVSRAGALSGTCTSDGSLDIIRAASDPYPVVDALEVAADGTLAATVRGSWFGDSGGRVLLDGAELEITSWNSHEIKVVLPASLASQKRSVQVERADGETGRLNVLVRTGEEAAHYENLPLPPLDDLGLRLDDQALPWRLVAAGGKLYATADFVCSNDDPFNGVLVYDPRNKTWDIEKGLSDFLQNRQINFAITSYDRFLYVLEIDPFKLYRYDPTTQTLSDPLDCDAALSSLGYDSHFVDAGSLTCDGRFIWIAGNMDADGYALPQAARLDIKTGEVRGLAPLTHERLAPTLCVVEGELLVAAGDKTVYGGGLVDGVERFRGDTWAFTSLPSEITPKQSGHAASAVLPAGATVAGGSTPHERMLLAGLNTADLSGSDTYVYDPVVNTWQALPVRLSATKLSFMQGAVVDDAFYVIGVDVAAQQPVFRRMTFELAPADEEGDLPTPSALVATGDAATREVAILVGLVVLAALALVTGRITGNTFLSGKDQR